MSKSVVRLTHKKTHTEAWVFRCYWCLQQSAVHFEFAITIVVYKQASATVDTPVTPAGVFTSTDFTLHFSISDRAVGVTKYLHVFSGFTFNGKSFIGWSVTATAGKTWVVEISVWRDRKPGMTTTTHPDTITGIAPIAFTIVSKTQIFSQLLSLIHI